MLQIQIIREPCCRRNKETAAGEDAREPAGRKGFPRSQDFQGFRIS